jgi:hypothetical protein
MISVDLRSIPSHSPPGRRTPPHTAAQVATPDRFAHLPDRERFAPGKMPRTTAAAGHIAQLPRDSQRDQCRLATPWGFPFAPESGPQSQPDPASESEQHLGGLAEAEIAAPARIYGASSSIIVLMLAPLADGSLTSREPPNLAGQGRPCGGILTENLNFRRNVGGVGVGLFHNLLSLDLNGLSAGGLPLWTPDALTRGERSPLSPGTYCGMVDE